MNPQTLPGSHELLENFRRQFHSEGRSTWEKVRHAPVRVLGSEVLRQWTKWTGRPVKINADLFFGERMEVLLPDGVGLHLHRYGYYENEMTMAFLQLVEPGMTVFDVGAHFGFYTLLASRLVGARGHVVSLEPTPRTFAALKRNTAHLGNSRLFQCAAYDEETTLRFMDFGAEGSALNQLAANGGPDSLSVQGRTLEGIMRETDLEPDFIKIDAERAEPAILRGMKDYLAARSPMVTLEVGDLASDPEHSRRLIGTMAELGYTAFEMVRGELVRHQLRPSYGCDNLLFKKV